MNRRRQLLRAIGLGSLFAGVTTVVPCEGLAANGKSSTAPASRPEYKVVSLPAGDRIEEADHGRRNAQCHRARMARSWCHPRPIAETLSTLQKHPRMRVCKPNLFGNRQIDHQNSFFSPPGQSRRGATRWRVALSLRALNSGTAALRVSFWGRAVALLLSGTNRMIGHKMVPMLRAPNIGHKMVPMAIGHKMVPKMNMGSKNVTHVSSISAMLAASNTS
jgi:hypothetical protein